MNGQSNSGKKALALQLRKTTSLSVRQIAVKVNANKTTVGGWLKGVPTGQDKRTGQDRTSNIIVRPGIGTGQSRTGHGTRGQSPSLVHSVHTGQDRTVQPLHGQSKVVQDTLKKASLIVKKVKPKKVKPKYEKAIMEKVILDPQPDEKESVEVEGQEEPKTSSGNIWIILGALLAIPIIWLIQGWLKPKESSELDTDNYEKPKPSSASGHDELEGGIYGSDI